MFAFLHRKLCLQNMLLQTILKIFFVLEKYLNKLIFLDYQPSSPCSLYDFPYNIAVGFRNPNYQFEPNERNHHVHEAQPNVWCLALD